MSESSPPRSPTLATGEEVEVLLQQAASLLDRLEDIDGDLGQLLDVEQPAPPQPAAGDASAALRLVVFGVQLDDVAETLQEHAVSIRSRALRLFEDLRGLCD